MTRLNAMRALLALPTTDGYTRSHEVVHTADADKLRITAVKIGTKRKPRRKAKKASRISWLRGVHTQKGA